MILIIVMRQTRFDDLLSTVMLTIITAPYMVYLTCRTSSIMEIIELAVNLPHSTL